jgi:hypothetical protein
MPEPKNLHWLAYSFSRRIVSVKSELPQSMMMSSLSAPAGRSEAFLGEPRLYNPANQRAW